MSVAAPVRGGRRNAEMARAILVLGVGLVLAAGMLYYYNCVLVPIWQKQSLITDAAPGNWSDLYPRWLGAQELLWHHRNPYSPEVTREIQRGFYGRPLNPSNPHDPTDPEAFVYPVYVAFLLAPFLRFPFDVVRAAYAEAMWFLTLVSIPLWMRALRVSLSPTATILACLGIMSSYAAIDGFHLEQLTLLVAFVMAASMAALVRGRLAIAGALLALTTIKPQLVLLVVACLLLWGMSDWRSRKWFAVGFGGLMAAFLVGSEVLLPGWFGLWRQAAREYVHFHRPSLLGNLLGNKVGLAVGVVGILLCGMVFWRARKEPAGSSYFNFAWVSALVMTELVVPNAGGGAFYNQLLLLPAVLWLFSSGRNLTEEKTWVRFTWWVAVVLLVSQWILASAVAFMAFALRHRFASDAELVAGFPALIVYEFPLALALFVLSAGLRLRRLERA